MRLAWCAEWTDPPDAALTMAHSSVVVTARGTVVTGATDCAALRFRTRQGDDIGRVRLPLLADVHGLSLVQEHGVELLWVASTGIRLHGGASELDARRVARAGVVAQLDLHGRIVRRLEPPPHPAYETSEFRPTAVAVDERRLGGAGHVYVADGYGASLVHCYDEDGAYLHTLSGEEGAGRFRTPHDVFIDRRATPELCVADRKNGRIQVYDLRGRLVRVVGHGALAGPTQLATLGAHLLATDLLAGRLSAFDLQGRLVAHGFAHPAPPRAWDDLPDAWPNARDERGRIGPATLTAGRFHAPHGIAVDDTGSVYVSEFSIGERIAVLRTPGAGGACT